jgi:hypothetical protein
VAHRGNYCRGNRHRERVCEAIGKQIFETTGVCCKVGDIRYSPLTEEEKQALAFDETAQSDDGTSYDEWEALRIAKGAAALKLSRRRNEFAFPPYEWQLAA